MQKCKANSFNQHTLSSILSTSKNKKFDCPDLTLLYMSQLNVQGYFYTLAASEETSQKQTDYGEGYPNRFISNMGGSYQIGTF